MEADPELKRRVTKMAGQLTRGIDNDGIEDCPPSRLAAGDEADLSVGVRVQTAGVHSVPRQIRDRRAGRFRLPQDAKRAVVSGGNGLSRTLQC